MKMEPPKNIKQLRGFVDAVIYYRDMWPHISHILAPLTSAVGTKNDKNVKPSKFVWTDEMQTTFDQMNAIMATDATPSYLGHNKRFDTLI